MCIGAGYKNRMTVWDNKIIDHGISEGLESQLYCQYVQVYITLEYEVNRAQTLHHAQHLDIILYHELTSLCG